MVTGNLVEESREENSYPGDSRDLRLLKPG